MTKVQDRVRWYAWRANPFNWIDLFSELAAPPKPAPILRRRRQRATAPVPTPRRGR